MKKRTMAALATALFAAGGAHAECGMPLPADGDRIVVLQTDHPDNLSTTALGSKDSVTWTAGLEIEPGDGRLYLVVLSEEPAIWRMSGAVERVSKIVTKNAGFIGIDAAKISYFTPRDCIRGYDYRNGDYGQLLGHSIGRAPDDVRRPHQPKSVKLPSGTSVSGDGGLDPKPATVDPTTVASDLVVEPYDVFPMKAGLDQLVASGRATANRSGHNEYVIRRPIPRYPAGLYGGHLANIVIAKDVPIPAGNSGHSCVVSELTGESVGDSPCGNGIPSSRPADHRSVVPPLRLSLAGQQAETGPPPDCGIQRPSPTSRIVVFGASRGSSHTDIQVGTTGYTQVIRVYVEPGTEPVYAVLAKIPDAAIGRTGPIVWEFEGSTDRIERVILPFTGSAVTGIAATKVGFTGCLAAKPTYYVGADGMLGEKAARVLGRKPDQPPFLANQTYGVSLPSLRTFDVDLSEPNPAPPGISDIEWDRTITYYTDTLGRYIPLADASVVSRDPVRRSAPLEGFPNK